MSAPPSEDSAAQASTLGSAGSAASSSAISAVTAQSGSSVAAGSPMVLNPTPPPAMTTEGSAQTAATGTIAVLVSDLGMFASETAAALGRSLALSTVRCTSSPFPKHFTHMGLCIGPYFGRAPFPPG